MTASKPVRIQNLTQGNTVCSAGTVADTFTLRLFGLLGKRALSEDGGLWITPSSGVHTFGMSFAIDVVAMDKQNRITGLWPSVGPWKIRGLSLKTKSVLELAPGSIERRGLAVGDQLAISPGAAA